MARRIFILALVLLAVTAGARPPHIVVYLSDDHSQYDASLYGDAGIPVPEMERLAADGMNFTHAFVASPSCAPSRAAMLTGLMPARNGAEDNHSFPRPGVPSLVPLLKELGYQTVAFGKIAHHQKNEDFGFEESGAEQHLPGLRSDVVKFLNRRNDLRPLCLFVGISNPHVVWPLESSFDPDDIKLPPHFIDTPQTRKLRAGYYEEIRELDELLGELRRMTGDKLGEDVLFIHTSDHGGQWPFAKWTLYDYGTRVPFIASWPGVIEAGSIREAMISWIDLLPTLIEIAGGEVPEGLDGRSFAALLKGTRKEHRDRIFTTHSGDRGSNVYPIRSVRTDDWKLIHNLRPDLAFTSNTTLLARPDAEGYWKEWIGRAKSDAEAKAIVDRYYQRPEFELYHVAEDKWEIDNLAGSEDHADLEDKLKAELAAWRESQGDEGAIFAEPRPIDRPETWYPAHIGVGRK